MSISQRAPFSAAVKSPQDSCDGGRSSGGALEGGRWRVASPSFVLCRECGSAASQTGSQARGSWGAGLQLRGASAAACPGVSTGGDGGALLCNQKQRLKEKCVHSLLGAGGEHKSWEAPPCRGRETAAVSSQPAPRTWNRPHGQVFKQTPRPSVGDVGDPVTGRGLGLHLYRVLPVAAL